MFELTVGWSLIYANAALRSGHVQLQECMVGWCTQLPSVGIVLGPLIDPERIIGLKGRPGDCSLTEWLGHLAEFGCNLRISPTRSFHGSYVECPGDGSCDMRIVGACPLE